MADKYALFIWPAYAATALVFAGLIGFSLNHARRWRKRYEDLRARQKEAQK